MKTANFSGAKNNRRIVALKNLKAQEATILRNNKEFKDEKDRKAYQEVWGLPRIQKEILTLESRITSPEVAAQHRSKKYRGA